MQTFLPYADFGRSVACLDRQRLGKQRLECRQILTALVVPGSGWARHPAVLMWEGHEGALVAYMQAAVNEWVRRGYANAMEVPHMLAHPDNSDSPPWLGDEKFHASHRSNLLRKDPAHYGQFGWTEPSDLPYVWPSVPKSGGSGRNSKKETTRMTTTDKALPDLSKLDVRGLEELHSEMLAQASDLGFEPSSDCLQEIGGEEQGRAVVSRLHEELTAFRAQKVLADNGKKNDTESVKKTTAKKAGQPKPDKVPAQQKENTVAAAPKKVAKKAAKKAPAKKVAKKAAAGGRASFDGAAKISWVRTKEGNGAREGSDRHERRELLRKHNGKTVDAYLKAGGSVSTLKRAVAEKDAKVTAA